MSVVSSSVRKSSDYSTFLNPVVVFNIFLVCLCGLGLVFYVASANGNTADNYRISSLRSQMSKLAEKQGSLSVEKTATENPISAGLFAKSKNMVEAKDIIYVFENSNVALQR
ncbi:MAG: hypothetical protein AAB638_01205 [Patescibacteria group bacterium]